MTSTDTMTPEQAQALRTAESNDVRLLSRKSRAELAAIERGQLNSQGLTRVFGGPVTKDELIRSIIDRRYPRERMTEAIHVLYHGGPGLWSGCPICQCQVTWTGPSAMVSGGVQLHQCELPPGHGGLHQHGQSFHD